MGRRLSGTTVGAVSACPSRYIREHSRITGLPFLDEFTEFRRDAIEGMRQPLEDRRLLERLGGMDDPGQERLRFLG